VPEAVYKTPSTHSSSTHTYAARSGDAEEAVMLSAEEVERLLVKAEDAKTNEELKRVKKKAANLAEKVSSTISK